MIDQLRLVKINADGSTGVMFENQVSNLIARQWRAKPELVSYPPEGRMRR